MGVYTYFHSFDEGSAVRDSERAVARGIIGIDYTPRHRKTGRSLLTDPWHSPALDDEIKIRIHRTRDYDPIYDIQRDVNHMFDSLKPFARPSFTIQPLEHAHITGEKLPPEGMVSTLEWSSPSPWGSCVYRSCANKINPYLKKLNPALALVWRPLRLTEYAEYAREPRAELVLHQLLKTLSDSSQQPSWISEREYDAAQAFFSNPHHMIDTLPLSAKKMARDLRDELVGGIRAIPGMTKEAWRLSKAAHHETKSWWEARRIAKVTAYENDSQSKIPAASINLPLRERVVDPQIAAMRTANDERALHRDLCMFDVPHLPAGIGVAASNAEQRSELPSEPAEGRARFFTEEQRSSHEQEPHDARGVSLGAFYGDKEPPSLEVRGHLVKPLKPDNVVIVSARTPGMRLQQATSMDNRFREQR